VPRLVISGGVIYQFSNIGRQIANRWIHEGAEVYFPLFLNMKIKTWLVKLIFSSNYKLIRLYCRYKYFYYLLSCFYIA